MKKLFLVFAMAVFTFANMQADQKQPVAFDNLPAPAKTFITKTFPQAQVSYALWERDDWFDRKYKVNFTDGTELEFDDKGNWTEVDLKMKAVPASIVPSKIEKYVTASFPNAIITEIQRKARMYKVKLSGDLELEFTKKGDFIRMDD